MSQKFEKLKGLLKELFQLDQPDLDFGLYRIMHAKSAEVTQFLDRDLLPQVKAEFGKYKTADKSGIEKELAKAIEQAQSLGADPETLPKVQELRAKLADDAVDIAGLESEVYDHLFGFFRRYYSEGDFLSKRVYKPGVYAIPYEGEEVKLHWANADQYYIKTSEYLRNYAFRLRPDDDANPRRVHFRLIDAAEGEHGNVKAAEGKDRVFILATGDVLTEEAGDAGPELVIRFEYRPATLTDWPDDVREGKTKPPAQKELTALAEKRLLAVDDATLAAWIGELNQPHIKADGERADYSRLRAHLNRYVARNTFDYFIHKDLGTFLRRELDFYIKNEVMHLDDVENETAPRVEQYLSKIKVIRRIAGKLIDFLAQLEDFQKRLWLKKKFVVETQYCITVGNIPESFHPEIAANDAQRDEWVRLLTIDDIKGDLNSPGYGIPLSPAFLKANPTLVVDTRLFESGFVMRLLDAIGDLDNETDGVIHHSENFQALALMHSRHREQVQCIYIDPPYNTGGDGFTYKDNYQHSSWMSMFQDRAEIARELQADSGVLFFSIDEIEAAHAWLCLGQLYGMENFASEIIWEKKKKPSFLHRNIGKLTDFIFAFNKDASASPPYSVETTTEGKLTPLNNAGNPLGILTFPPRSVRFGCADGVFQAQDMSGGNIVTRLLDDVVVHESTNEKEFRLEGEWRYSQAKLNEVIASDDELYISKAPFRPNHIKSGGEVKKMKNSLSPVHYEMETNEDASQQINDLLGGETFRNPKPEKLIRYLVRSVTHSRTDSYVLDYFAGSGTTAHATISLNREDGRNRKFILVEMGDYLDAVLLARIKKVTFSPSWKDGKPIRLATPEEAERSPRIVKVLRLESYEDALNNLVPPKRTAAQQSLLDTADAQGADGFKEQYLLRYMLDVETAGSQSLLNVQAFADPTAYRLKVKRPGSDESREVNVDLLETFNWLIGLKVQHIAAPQTFTAEFERDAEKRLQLKGRLKLDEQGPWWFRRVEGQTPDGRKTLIVWRKLTGDAEQDNLVLDVWMKDKLKISTQDFEYDLIYVNGTNNLENLRTPDDTWKVRLIEEDFHRLMFATEGV